MSARPFCSGALFRRPFALSADTDRDRWPVAPVRAAGSHASLIASRFDSAAGEA